MSFYEYIQTFKDDKTPLGELAIWIKEDDSFPKQEKLTEIFCLIFIKCPI
ncbi:Putative cytosolic protein [Staphylococcus aureus]|nr:Putative cytosolic protein [Staphylococcus aureus]